MKKYSKVLGLVFLLTAVVMAGQTLYQQGQDPTIATQQNGDDDFPIASYDAAAPAEAKEADLRKLRGRRYDNWGVVNETTKKGGMTINGGIEYPALPVADSDLIIIGEVVEARAYLSNDKSGVYSEFMTRVNETLKQSAPASLALGSVLTIERPGGRVKFPAGGVVKFRIIGQGMPRQGRQYLLFLKHNEERRNYTILTGYELRADKVFPIDGAHASIGNRTWPYDTYKGVDKLSLLSDLQKEISHPSQKAVVY